MYINIPYKYKFYGYKFIGVLFIITLISYAMYSLIQYDTYKNQYFVIFMEMTKNLDKQDMPNLYTIDNVYEKEEIKKLLIRLDLGNERNENNIKKLGALINQISRYKNKSNKSDLGKIYASYRAILTLRDLTKKYDLADPIYDDDLNKDRKALINAYGDIYSFRVLRVLKNYKYP